MLTLAGCAAETRPATSVTDTSAVLNAVGQTDSSQAHVWFEYARDVSDFATPRALSTETRVVEPNIPQTPFSYEVNNLQPNTTYRFRVCGYDARLSTICNPSGTGANYPSFTTSAPRMPPQFVAKQYTEALGRAPTTQQWETWRSHFTSSGNACSSASLSAMTRQIYTSSEFLGLGYDSASRLLALYRGVLNREPDQDGLSAYVAQLDSGSATWLQVVNAVLASSEFAALVPKICSSTNPNYYVGTAPPIALSLTSGGFSGNQQALQQLLDATPTGGTVWLAQRALIKICGNGIFKPTLTVPPGVRLATTGLPDNAHYVNMARLVRDPRDTCPDPVVQVGGGTSPAAAGGTLQSIWVDGAGGNPGTQINGGDLQTRSGANVTISNSRFTNPGIGFVTLGLRGFGNDGEPCTNLLVNNNMVTGYSRDHRSSWSDGITLGCEDAIVSDNTIVDASDVGIVVFGNRHAGQGARQRSQVFGNAILSAGNGAYAAIGVDPNGACDASSGACTDLAERDFSGTKIRSNTLYTGPRTSFGFGLSLGIRSLFGDGPDGRGASATDNSTGSSSAQVSLGVGVSGMFDTEMSRNTGNFLLNPDNTCPQVRVGASVSAGYATFIGSPQSYSDVLIRRCWASHP